MTNSHWKIVWRQAVRPALRRPGLSLLTVGGIALGVAVFLAVQIANRAALESFRASVELTAGRADLEVRGELEEELFLVVKKTPGVRAAAPVVEGIAPLAAPRGEYLRILGVDILAAPELFAFRLEEANGAPPDFERWMAEPGMVAVAPAQAARMASWGEVEALTGTGRHRLRPAFVLSADDALLRAEPRMAVMDIGWAQVLLGCEGALTAIHVRLEEGADAMEVAARLAERLPAGTQVAPPARRSGELETMLGAFQLNLTAMSFVSVVVGMFLVYNSVSAAVVRRQAQIAILRCCGASRAQVRGLFLAEAAAEAAAGAALGVMAAPWLASFLAQPIGQTLASLYELASLDAARLQGDQVVMGMAVGIGAALMAAWIPASEAARVSPAAILHLGAPNRVFAPKTSTLVAAALISLAMAALSGWLALATGPSWLGFVSAGLVLAGFTFLVPLFVRVAAAFGRRCGHLGRLAASLLERSLHRNGVTVAAMAAAAAMAVAVGVMIHSFRASVERWTARTLASHAYIAPAANELGGLHTLLPEKAAAWVRAHPLVESVAAFREVEIRWRGEPVALGVLDGPARGALELLPGSHPDAMRLYEAGKAALVSESFVNRFREKPEEIVVELPGGVVRLPTVGIFRDYTRDRGTIFVQRRAVQRALAAEAAHSLAILLHDPSRLEAFRADFLKAFGDQGEFAIYDNAALRARILEIFDQTFAVTAALRGVAVFVAFIGTVFSLSILASERMREIGVLRALGASRGQVLGVFLGEAAMVGGASAIGGLGSGAALAVVLTWVINKAFFGWSIALAFPIETMAWFLPMLVVVAVLAGWWPAWRAACTPPAAAVRFE